MAFLIGYIYLKTILMKSKVYFFLVYLDDARIVLSFSKEHLGYFSEAHATNNIYKMIRRIIKEYGLTSKNFF